MQLTRLMGPWMKWTLILALCVAPSLADAQPLSRTDGTAVTSTSGIVTLGLAAGTLAAPSLVFTGSAERGLYSTGTLVGIAGGAHVTGPLTVAALATPGSITVTPQGTPGATTYTYVLVATVGGATTEAGANSSTATGNAVLDGTNFNRLTWTAVAGATGYRIYRTVGGATQGLISTIALGATVTVDDTGLAGGGETAPSTNASGQVLAAPGAGAAPSLALSVTNTGFYWASAGIIGVTAAGTEGVAAFTDGPGLRIRSTGYLGFSSGTATTTGADTILYRDAANTLAMRNLTAAQTFNFAATYTDASNYIRGQLSATSTAISLIAQGAGTGATANADITLTPINTGRVKIGSPAIVTATDGSAVPALAVTNMVGSTGGPTTAAQNGWLVLKDSTGAVIWIAVWK